MDFIDLHRQYDLIEQDLQQRLKKVLTHKHFIMGEEVEELEDKLSEYTGRKHTITCSNGTTALVLPLMAWDLKPTDAVFVPAFTFFASAESVNLAGGTPVFIDSDDSFNIDIQHLEQTIEQTLADGILNPRGIIPVDLFGLSANYDEIIRIAEKYNLFIIEDAAQGFGGQYCNKKNGSFGNVSTTSFFPAKPLGCYGDGGAILTDDDDMAELIRSLRVHGQGSSRYDNIRIGINGRLDTIQAAVLLSKLEVLDNELNVRNQIAEKYSKNLKAYFKTPEIPSNCISAWAQYTLLAKDKKQRKKIIETLKEYQIPVMVYYAIPMHLQTAYQYLGYRKGDLPKCEDFCERVFSIPMYPYLSNDEIDFISDKLIKAITVN